MKIVEDEKYLKCESDIAGYFSDVGADYLDCGQGYFSDETEIIAKIGDKYYTVHIKAEIFSAKQDRGDRLYWVEEIDSVSYTEIEKSAVEAKCKSELMLVVKKAEEALNKAKKELADFKL